MQGVKLDENDPKGGVGLRISRRKFGRALSGNMDWTTLSFDFAVQQERANVELVSELRALEGEVWFDLDSLRLRRK